MKEFIEGLRQQTNSLEEFISRMGTMPSESINIREAMLRLKTTGDSSPEISVTFSCHNDGRLIATWKVWIWDQAKYVTAPTLAEALCQAVDPAKGGEESASLVEKEFADPLPL